MAENQELPRRRAPTLWLIIAIKLVKGLLFAGLVIVMIPTLVVYILLQERLTKGVTLGALKG